MTNPGEWTADGRKITYTADHDPRNKPGFKMFGPGALGDEPASDAPGRTAEQPERRPWDVLAPGDSVDDGDECATLDLNDDERAWLATDASGRCSVCGHRELFHSSSEITMRPQCDVGDCDCRGER